VAELEILAKIRGMLATAVEAKGKAEDMPTINHLSGYIMALKELEGWIVERYPAEEDR